MKLSRKYLELKYRYTPDNPVSGLSGEREFIEQLF